MSITIFSCIKESLYSLIFSDWFCNSGETKHNLNPSFFKVVYISFVNGFLVKQSTHTQSTFPFIFKIVSNPSYSEKRRAIFLLPSELSL